MGQGCPPFYGTSKFYEKKKERAIAKIDKLREVIAECERAIAAQNKNGTSAKN
jgi:hypothetical protein